jgi:hypothetical protein
MISHVRNIEFHSAGVGYGDLEKVIMAVRMGRKKYLNLNLLSGGCSGYETTTLL